MVNKIAAFCIRQRIAVVVVVGIATLVLAYFAVRVDVKTDFNDLLPKNHPYIKINNQFKETFGGSNMVSIMLEVDENDIFSEDVLKKIRNITNDLNQVKGVNQFQIISLASKKLKDIIVSGNAIESHPLMWPDLPKDEAERKKLREKVLNNPLIFGTYVSTDLKSTLINVDFYDQLVDYDVAYRQIMSIIEKYTERGIHIRVVGEPILYGWVRHFLPETFHIFLFTIALLCVVLFTMTRTWRGTLLPLLAGSISATWALGIAKILNFNFDPLVIVIAFLITARSISHSTQLVTRFDDEISQGAPNPIAAAEAAMANLFRPGMLGVVADAGCMIIVALTPIPLLEKVAIIGTVWVLTIAVSAVVLTPVLLSWVRRPEGYAHSLNLLPSMHKLLDFCVSIISGRARASVLIVATVVFIGSGMYAFKLKVGDANPGSPILWGDSAYNKDAKEINTKFRGSDRMFVVFAGNKYNTLTQPDVLFQMNEFQRFMESQPEIGWTISLADVLPTVKRTLYEDNPRFEELGRSAEENGELAYLFISGSDPGDSDRFTDAKFQNGSVSLYFRDHQGETIRTAISRIKEFTSKHRMKDVAIRLAGGFVGGIAAVNEVILSGQIESIALALLILVICCLVTYRSAVAGMFFMVPVLISNTLTFSYMAFKGIGMNINTLPVSALGIGLGVDYAFYIVDGIREELKVNNNLREAILKSMRSAGKGVLITAISLVASVVLWWFSSLRFQAEMGIMMGLWLCVSAICALLITPAMVYIFRPEFVVGKGGVSAIEKTREQERKVQEGNILAQGE